MKKSDIERLYECQTGQTYKHEPLYVGDVYKNNLGTMGIVLAEEIDGKIEYIYQKTNLCKHILPADKAGMGNSEFVANVVQDDSLMQLFIENGIIIDDTKEEKETKPMAKDEKKTVAPPPVVKAEEPKNEPKQEAEPQKPIKTAKKKAEPKKVEEPKEDEKPIDTKQMNIYEKINAIRVAWSTTDVEKAGKGRAGGGAKYDYYKPQQIIDFCLAQEVKHRLYSKFSVVEDRCYYELTDLDNLEMTEVVSCPFDIPRKMAASEAQQVGAAMTYHNRRLAMMMYKIEDNSKESVDVLENADYTEPLNIPTPPIVPPAPIITPPPVQTVVPPAPATNIQPEAVSKPIDESKPADDKKVDLPWQDSKNDNVAGETKQNDEVTEEMKQEPKKVEPPKNVFGKEIPAEQPKTVTPPPATVAPPKTAGSVPPPPPAASVPPTTAPAAEKPVEQPKKKSIESLY